VSTIYICTYQMDLLETESRCSRCRKIKPVDAFGQKPENGGLYKICIKCREYALDLYSSKKVSVSDTKTGQIVQLPISDLIGNEELLEHSWSFLTSCLDSMAKKGWVFSHPASGFQARYENVPEDADSSIEITPFIPPSTIIPVTRKIPEQPKALPSASFVAVKRCGTTSPQSSKQATSTEDTLSLPQAKIGAKSKAKSVAKTVAKSGATPIARTGDKVGKRLQPSRA
jgi:hypothetical protein